MIGSNPVVDDDLWRAWVHKGKQRERVTDRRLKIFIATILIILVVGVGFYVYAIG
jgi:hypothetical protein